MFSNRFDIWRATLLVSLLPFYPAWAGNPIFEASFSGTGAGVGGPGDLVTTGGNGHIRQTPEGEVKIATDDAFGSGNYLIAVVRKNESESGKPAGQFVEFFPSDPSRSFAAWGIRNKEAWQVSGALDFVFSPDHDVKRVGQFIPLATGKNPGGLTLMIRNIPEGSDQGAFCAILEGPPNAFGPGVSKVIAAPDPSGTPFALRAAVLHHLALTLQTDKKTGETVLRIYGRENGDEIVTTEGSPDLLGEKSFALNMAAITSSTLFSPAAFKFGNLDGRGINQEITNEKSQKFDSLRIYNFVPQKFAQSGS